MLMLSVNGAPHAVPAEAMTVAELLAQLGVDAKRVAVEVNRELVPRSRHAQTRLAAGDEVEVVTLVGGGSPSQVEQAAFDEPLKVGSFTFRSRLITGSGKYPSYDVM